MLNARVTLTLTLTLDVCADGPENDLADWYIDGAWVNDCSEQENTVLRSIEKLIGHDPDARDTIISALEEARD